MLIPSFGATAARRALVRGLTAALLALVGVGGGPPGASADTLRQSDWSAGPGVMSSADVSDEAGFAVTTGQWAFSAPGELQASEVLFVHGASGSAYALATLTSAGSASSYVGFGACVPALIAPAPACRTLTLFVHRDSTSGALSLVSLADGSGQMGCAGAYTARFTASAGVTLTAATDPGEVTLVAGVGDVAHSWSSGCADGFILQLPTAGGEVDGALTGRSNLQHLQVGAAPVAGAFIPVSLSSLPNNGSPGSEVPFTFLADRVGSLESAVFALGAPRQLLRVDLDAAAQRATVAVFVRTGATEAAALAAAWSGPFTSGAPLGAVPPGAFVQYRLDVTLPAGGGPPGSPEPFVLSEVRIEHDAPCPCVIDATCYADAQVNPSNPCERCSASVDASAWTPNDGAACDDGRFCTATDTCVAATCVGAASPCADALSCTDDACDESNDSCTHVVASGCAIDGACVPAGAGNPSDACEQCDPARPTQWSLAPGCAGCNSGAACSEPGLGVCDLEDHACVECSVVDASPCDPLRPVCDPTARACRGCTSDAECGAVGAPRCASDGRCVACLDHLDCPTDAPICTLGRCAVCLTNTECFDRDPGAAVCDDTSGRCGACQDESMCLSAASGLACLARADGNRCGCRVEADCQPGTTCDVARQRCAPLAGADSDQDGVPDDKDADDDDDGITDLVEGGGEDFSLDFDQDGVPNWRDPDAPRFVDLNDDGTDDNSDADGDGVPNQRDLDSDGDGVPDSLENAGRDVLDRDRDGHLDDARDADRDGLHATADADDNDPALTTSVVPLRDTDADDLPDYLDQDADAEAANDTVEAGGADADEDGQLDGFSDTNMNGLADRVDPALGGTPLALPDSDLDGVWDFQDASEALRVSVQGGGLCHVSAPHSTGGSGSGRSAAGEWSLLVLALGVLLGRRRARARG
jgi:hypothetical protein